MLFFFDLFLLNLLLLNPLLLKLYSSSSSTIISCSTSSTSLSSTSSSSNSSYLTLLLLDLLLDHIYFDLQNLLNLLLVQILDPLPLNFLYVQYVLLAKPHPSSKLHKAELQR